ncbi:hypothetical protein F2Q70_00040779 [Brassica cretica]|uniref:Uncharacterized protein n=1 Tax=Brassica cretica TaxID=69181 RepID=A0A8S9K573_BRACR|nr:hypothetical protein F2Q70_00040779 [Brassica cretica]
MRSNTRRSTTEKQASEDSEVDNLRHFSVYLFAGRTCVLRLSKKTDIYVALSNYNLSKVLKPEICRGLKFECMEFRESILGVMPHHWDRREDTLLKLAHFRRHKRKILKKQAGKATISQTSGTHTSWNRLVEKDSKIDQEGCALCWLGNT